MRRSDGLLKILAIIMVVGYSEISGASNLCNPKTGSELFRCLRDQHVESKKSKFDFESARGNRSQAGAWINPEVGISGIVGDNFGQKTSEIQTDLQFTLELGGKISARKGRAEVEKNLAELDLKLTEDQVAVEAGVSVLRLKQLDREISSFQEALDTFSRIERQYRSRGRLSPEQEVSLAVFEVAAKDTALKLNSLYDELKALRDEILNDTGSEQDFDWKNLNLNDFRPKFPETLDVKVDAQNSIIQRAQLEYGVAEKSLHLEQANSWPDLRFGPIFKINTDGSDRFLSGGVGISFPLPIFNLNGGARAAARANAQKAQLESGRKSQEATRLKTRLLDSYKRITAHTSKMNDIEALDRKHRRLEVLFAQGVVSSALVIESHRQLLEFLQEYHTAERTQLEILWKFYSIEGRLNGEIKL